MTERKIINIALAGNANVGKSVIFNQLTGMNQCIGNWPGKTVEKCEGKLTFLNYNFNIVDLPGIYSLSTYSIEEIISREFLIGEKVDLIVNVIDGTNLERNLFFTVQLIGLNLPMILAVNQLDLVRKRKIKINLDKLEKIFKIPVIPVIAVHGRGVHELLEKTIEMFENEFQIPNEDFFKFGKEVETGIQKLIDEINNYTDELKDIKYPSRFLAIKILEKDDELIGKIKRFKPEIIDIAAEIREELEELHGEDINTIISAEIYNRIHEIINQSVVYGEKQTKATWADKLDHLTTHSIFGYVLLFIILFGSYWVVFTVGDIVGGWLDEIYEFFTPIVFNIFGDNIGTNIFWNGAMAGLFGGVGGVLVYVIPFFIIIEILQDSGYLPRAAFMMDKFMHQVGVHGKAIIPLILGLGCNVPGCTACRIMETEREKKITAFLTTLVPCAAVMAVIMGLVAKHLGFIYAIILYGIDFAVIILFGKLATKFSHEPQTELIMEMHEFRKPNTSVILKQTWFRSKEFVYKAMPLIIIIGMLMEIMLMFNLLEPINVILQPITVLWLGLPVITGIFLIYGILRKELTLVLLEILAVDILGIALSEFMTPIQMFVFALITMLYIPCAATIIVLKNETGWKFTLKVTFIEIGFALLLGGIVNWGYFFIIGGG
ncbi:MAG: ferrous iron transport protein B [Candidatus Lokiarchaeota archaeon]|nr:ferrous iron transport protein B [Candidatus Lokiarchaeota archaeon]